MTLISRLKQALSQFSGTLETSTRETPPRIPHIASALSDTVQRRVWFTVQKKLLETGIREIETGKPITPFMQMLYELTAMNVIVISKRLLEADADGGNANKRSPLLGDWCRGHRWATLDTDEEQDALSEAFLTVRSRDVRVVGAREDWDLIFDRFWNQVPVKRGHRAAVKAMLSKYTVTRYQEFLTSFENDWLPYWQSMVALGKDQYVIGMERFVREEQWKQSPQRRYNLDGKSAMSAVASKEKSVVKEYKKKHDNEEIEVVSELDIPEFDLGGG